MASLEEVLAQINGSGPDLTMPEDVLGGQAGSAASPDLPRGLRNNNPGNIRRSAIPWQGKVEGSDAEFETFDTPANGMRALERNLTAYQTKHNLRTPREIINRWAPPTENDTGSYVNAVSQALGVNPDDPIDVQDPAVMQKLRDAVIHHENGQNPYAGSAAAPSAAPAAPRGVDVAGARKRALDFTTGMQNAVNDPTQGGGYEEAMATAVSLLKGPAANGDVSASDYGKSAVASLGSLGSMAAGVPEYLTRKLGDESDGQVSFLRSLTPQFEAMRGATDDFTKRWLDSRSQEAKDRAERQFTNLGADTMWQGGVGEFVSSLALKGAESLAPTIVPLGGAALLGRLSMVAASTVLGASETVLTLGATAAQMSDAVRDAPIEELMQSPKFQERLKAANGNEVAAREAFINDVQGWTPIITGAIVGLIAKGVGKQFDEIFTPEFGLGLVKRTAVGFGSEATQEGGQSAAEQIAANVGRRVYSSDTGVWDGVLEASLQGAAVGGPMGGGMAAAFGTPPKQAIKVNANQTNGVANDIAAAVNPVPTGKPRVPNMTAIPTAPLSVDPTGAMSAPEQGGMFEGIGPDAWAAANQPPPVPNLPGTPGMGFSNQQTAETMRPPTALPPMGTPGEYNFPGPPEQDTGGLELAPEVPRTFEREDPPNSGPQVDPNEIPYAPDTSIVTPRHGGPAARASTLDASGQADMFAPAPQPSDSIPYQPNPEDQVLQEGQPPERTSRQQVGWRVRRFDGQGNLIASKLMGKEEAANGLARVWQDEADRAGNGDTIELVPARQTLFGDQSPDAEPLNDYMAQIEDLDSPDRRGVYVSKKGLAYLNSIGELDNVLKSGVPIQNFDNLGGIMIAKDAAAAKELIDLKENDAGSIDEIIGYATTAGRGKIVSPKAVVVQRTNAAGDVVRERQAMPDEVEAIKQEWGGDPNLYRVLTQEKALARRKGMLKVEGRVRKDEANRQDVGASKRKAEALYSGPLIGGDRQRATSLIESDPEISEEQVGEKLIQSAVMSSAEERKRRKIEDLPLPQDTFFRGKEVTAAARTEFEGRRAKAELTKQKAELVATPLASKLEDRQSAIDAIDAGLAKAAEDVQKAGGTVSGSAEVMATRRADYDQLYNKLVAAAARVELERELGEEQDVVEAQAVYKEALNNIKQFMKVEGAYTRGEALMEAASRFSPKARKKVWSRTAGRQTGGDLTAVEKAASQGVKERTEETTTDEMSPKEAASAGKLRNTGEQVTTVETSIEDISRRGETSATMAAQSGRVKLYSKRMEKAAAKLEEMLQDPEARFLVRRWLSEYMQALRQNIPAVQRKDSRDWKWHGRAARTTEMIGSLFGDVVAPTTQKMGLEAVSTRVVKLATRANRLGIGAEVDPSWFLAAVESGKVETLKVFLSDQVTPLEPAKNFPSDLTKEQLEAMDAGTLNALYVRAVNFMDAQRTPDMVRAFMARGIKRVLGAKFSSTDFTVAASYREFDRLGGVKKEVTEPLTTNARKLYSELISGSRSMQGTAGDKRMPIDQLKELYKIAVAQSRSLPAKERLPERPLAQHTDKLLRRVAKSDKIEDVLRASAKAGKERIGTGGTQLTRTAVDKTDADKFTKAESKYSPGVLLNNDPPRELKGDAKTKHEAKARQAVEDMATEFVAFGEFVNRLSKGEYAAIANERGDDDTLTPKAQKMQNARTYAAWLHMYLGSFVSVNEASALTNPKLLDELRQLLEDLQNIRKLTPKQFTEQLGGSFLVEMEAQSRRAKGAINNSLDKRNPQSKAEWADASLARIAEAELFHTRLTQLWQKNEDFVGLIQPIMEKIRTALVADKWYSYAPSKEEVEAVEFLFARWSRLPQWMDKLTDKQRKLVEAEPFDKSLKKDLYDSLYKRLDAAGFFNRDIALEKRFLKRFAKDEGTPRERVLEGDVVYRTDEDGNRIPTVTGKEVGGAWALPESYQTPVEKAEQTKQDRATEERLTAMSDEAAAKLPARQREERARLLGESAYTAYVAKLKNVEEAMTAFRESMSRNLRNVTAFSINAAESRMIEALRELGAWKDLNRREGTGTIKLPDYATVSADLAAAEKELQALEVKYGYHRRYNRETKQTEPVLIGGERTDAKGRLLGPAPEYASKREKLAERINGLSAQLRALPKDPTMQSEAITYRLVGPRLVSGQIQKADIPENTSVLKLRRFMEELKGQLALDLPKTSQPRGAKYKGYLKETPAKPLTAKEELAQAKAEARQSLDNQQAPLPFEVAQAVRRLSGGLNLDITAMGGDARTPTGEEYDAAYAIRDQLSRGQRTMGEIVSELQRSLPEDHPYQPLLEKLLTFRTDVADKTVVRFVDDIPSKTGRSVGRLTMDGNTPTIILLESYFTGSANPLQKLHVVLHELVHAATVANIIGPMYGNRELKNRIDLLRKVAREKFGDRFAYATSDVYEFVAEAYTNAEFQQALKDYKAAELAKSSLWNRFVNIVRTILGLDTEFTDLLDAVMTITSDAFGPTAFDKYSKRVTDLERTGLNLTADAFLDKHVTPIANALGDRAKLRADTIRKGKSLLQEAGEIGSRFMAKSLTIRQLVDFFRTSFDSTVGNALDKWFAAWEARNADASKALEEADQYSRRWTLLRDESVEQESAMSELMVDSTTYGIHPDADFPSKQAFAAKTELAALKAQKNRKAYEDAKERYDATYGKLPNAHLEESQRGDYDKLRAEWNKLSPKAQQLYTDVRKFYRETVVKESKLMLLNAIRSSSLWEGDFTLTENDIDFSKIEGSEDGMSGWLQRTLKIDIAAEQKLVAEAQANLKAQAGNLSKEDLKLRKRALKRAEINVKAEIDQLRIIGNMAKIPQLRKGPYFPLRRFGDYVARATKLLEERTFASRSEAMAWAAEMQLSDPTIQFKYPPREDGLVHVVALEVEYRTGESYTEAEEERQKLIKLYGNDAVSDVDTKSNQFNNEASIPSNAALQTLLGKLKDNPGAQAAIRNFYLQTLSDKSFRKNELKRKTIRGADPVHQQRAFAFYAKSASYYMAQLRHGHVMATAKQEMDAFISANREKPGDRHSTLMLRKVFDELKQRDEQAAEIHDLPKFIRRSVEYGQFMLLTSPSYWMINASQPWMVTVPWLSGYTSTLDAANELRKAQKLILHPLLTEAGKSYGGFKALWSKTTAESAFTVVKQVETQIAKSNHPRAADLVRMIDELKQASIIDLSFVAELRQIAVGEEGGMADAILDASRIMAHLTEVNNRIMTSIAAYEIYRKKGLSHEQAVLFAKHAVAKTQFDYSAANKPRLFSANDAAWKPLVFQFMQYAQHMYVMMFEQVGAIMRNKTHGERQRALRILGGMLGSHLIAGGIIGMTIQPIKWAMGLLAMAFGDDDEDNTFRNAVSGETYDRWVAEALSAVMGTNKLSEVLRAGAPRAIGIDLSSRMALGQLYMADLNPKNAETLAGSIAMSFLGPMPGLIGNLYQSAQKFAEGDLDRAAELASPKGVRDVIRAYRFMDEGVSDSSGKIIMRPDQLTPVDLFWQASGFSPSALAELYARNSSVKDRQMFANERKAAVMKMQRMVRVTGEYREAQQALREYNRQFPENPISFSEVVKSLSGQREDERVVQKYGATLGDTERAYAREGDPYNVR